MADMQCTYWLDGWPKWMGGTGEEWLPCCKAHDLAGLSLDSGIALGKCVAATSPAMGVLMASAVLVFGPTYLMIRKARKRRAQE